LTATGWVNVEKAGQIESQWRAGGVSPAFNAATTLSILINGREASTGYSQLAVAGLTDLGGSTLSLNLGFEPPAASSFEIVTNTSSLPISGMFSGLNEGAVFNQGGYGFRVTYQGGSGGSSVVLTRLA
jgi:hypothetical protein